MPSPSTSERRAQRPDHVAFPLTSHVTVWVTFRPRPGGMLPQHYPFQAASPESSYLLETAESVIDGTITYARDSTPWRGLKR